MKPSPAALKRDGLEKPLFVAVKHAVAGDPKFQSSPGVLMKVTEKIGRKVSPCFARLF